MIKELFTLRMPEPESRQIWKEFQPKFSVTFNLYNYYIFFEKLLIRICKNYLKECVTIVEFRHIFGCLFYDDQKTVPLEAEIAIFKRVEAMLRIEFPLFQIKIIVCGLKIFGRPHIKAMLESIEATKDEVDLVVGFDLVCEEDWNPKCDEFLDLILAT
jgi:hypothetical protein